MVRKSSLLLLIPLITVSLILSPSSPASAAKPKRQVKNVIFLLADGTSWSTISLGRWMQRYQDNTRMQLNIDPYITGSVITYCADAPTGDSAPTMSCYMTGTPSTTGFISTYPIYKGKDNLVPLDSTRAYFPLMTLQEAFRIQYNGAIGLVATSQFPHATPAACASHFHDRDSYDILAQQMARNKIDVIIGGGTKYVTDTVKRILKNEGILLYLNDLNGMKNHSSGRFWAIFGKKSIDFDIDHDGSKQPTLEMATRTAIEHLSKNKNGFFLMVEGSKIDWAAHDNDPAGMYHELLAFDKACKVALDFAEKDKNTLVIITADHGNSGLALGSKVWPEYDTYSADQLFNTLSKITISAKAMAAKIKECPYDKLDHQFKKLCGFTLYPSDRLDIIACKDYKGAMPEDILRKRNSLPLAKPDMVKTIGGIYARHSFLEFTTYGHTAEEVFLVCHNPKAKPLSGVVQNFQLHGYIAEQLGFTPGLKEFNDKHFAPHTQLFDAKNVQLIKKANDAYPTLHAKTKKGELIAKPFDNAVTINGKKLQLSSLIIYSPERNLFFLPTSLAQ